MLSAVPGPALPTGAVPGPDFTPLSAATTHSTARTIRSTFVRAANCGLRRRKAMPSDTVELAVYRIAQECLNNALRHAGATEIGVRVDYLSDGVTLTVAGLAIGLALSDVAARLMIALLYGFRPAWRGQPHNTFKLLFNGIFLGGAR